MPWWLWRLEFVATARGIFKEQAAATSPAADPETVSRGRVGYDPFLSSKAPLPGDDGYEEVTLGTAPPPEFLRRAPTHLDYGELPEEHPAHGLPPDPRDRGGAPGKERLPDWIHRGEAGS